MKVVTKKMINHKLSIISVPFLFLCNLVVFQFYAEAMQLDDFGCRIAPKTLNLCFNFDNRTFKTGTTSKTGAKEILYNGNSVFDLDLIHKQLKESADSSKMKSSNVVVASISVILFNGTDIEVEYDFLKEDKTKPNFFINGVAPKNKLDNVVCASYDSVSCYYPPKMLQSFRERIGRDDLGLIVMPELLQNKSLEKDQAHSGKGDHKLSIKLGDLVVDETLGGIDTQDKELIREDLAPYKPQISEKTSTGHTHSALSHSVITEHSQSWGKATQQSSEEKKLNTKISINQMSEILDRETECLAFTLKKHLQNITKAVDEMVHQESSSFGSSIDSEQFLLSYLKEINPMYSSMQGENDFNEKIFIKYNDLLYKYKERKIKKLNEDFSKSISINAIEHSLKSPEDLKIYFDELDEKYSSLKKLLINLQEKTIEVGFILHLHSPLEICHHCSYSIAQEMRFGILKKLKGMIIKHNNLPYDPFVIVTASSSIPLESTNQARKGINYPLEEENTIDGLASIDGLLNKGLFLQKKQF
jgi:hypothetical protein